MKILIVGEICQDIFVYGSVDRISPEAPVPVFVPIEKIKNDGMAGNVVSNIKAIDPKIKTISLHQKNQITKTRFVEKKSNHMFIRVDEGEDKIEKLFLDDDIISIIKGVDAVIVSDYNKGFLTDDIILEITKNAKFSVMDSKRKINRNIVNAFDFIKLNEKEFERNKFEETDLSKLLITLGSKGAKYLNKVFQSPDPKETIDVSGAGDTFTASFTIKYLETKSVEESIIYANKMASIVVSKRGVATP
jgi:D-beta-D-heptose 7-phosphate kinase/D-beta-D-heptose 1-phosphate adenosyltransferase